MRRLLPLAFALTACSAPSTPGTLGLPTPVPSATAAATVTRAPTAPPPASPSASPARSASPSPSASASATPTATRSATPTPAPSEEPFVVTMSATQVTLTVVYSEPMKARLACGTSGPATGALGTIDNQRSGEATSSYHATDRALDETLQSATQATINADCTAVTFLYSLAAPAGTFVVTVSSVQDVDGETIDATRNAATVTIRDDGPPVALRVEAFGDSIYVTFSEPMLQFGEGGHVTNAGNYRLDGSMAPIAQITCNDAGCRAVRLWLRAGTIVPGRSYALRIANVVDRSGRGILPDPTTLTFVGR